MQKEEVVIVGAGIAGLAIAVALKRVGIKALVLERSQGLSAVGGQPYLFTLMLGLLLMPLASLTSSSTFMLLAQGN
jgi:2-polyprenyl-6-methoxyphenol hydroxylase-like FAD-dependent oxidoreductase